MASDSFIHAVAGAAGGSVAMTVTYPLIFVSTRAAVDTENKQKTTYQAVIDVIRSAEGISGLYSGLNSSLLGISVTNFVYYYFYEKGRSSLLAARSSPGSKGLSTVESLLNGFIAGSATSIISNPIWVIQTQQAVRTMVPSSSDPNAPEKVVVVKKLSFMETAMNIINKSGVGALWSGIGPALILVINPIIQYTVFEQLKNFIMQRRTTKLRAAGSPRAASMSDFDYFILGAVSKLVATSLTYPYIVVKSRLQAGSAQYTSAWAGLQAILGKEGVAGLYKGISTKLIQSVLTAAILFAGQKRVYEVTKKVLTGAGLAKV
ncbi:mitochondrial carrier [Serendipita vermifera]|nr:mitochondrial carrier [Serendipita vermifera]